MLLKMRLNSQEGLNLLFVQVMEEEVEIYVA
jgi:hypothetical protein